MKINVAYNAFHENGNEDKTKTEMTQSFCQYSENETEIWRQNILNQFNRVSSFSFRNLSNERHKGSISE